MAVIPITSTMNKIFCFTMILSMKRIVRDLYKAKANGLYNNIIILCGKSY